jgi:hypothetical protein
MIYCSYNNAFVFGTMVIVRLHLIVFYKVGVFTLLILLFKGMNGFLTIGVFFINQNFFVR